MLRSPIIEMSRRYPFDKQCNPIPTAVRLRRKYKQTEYPQLRKKIDIHSKLENSSIIKIQKGFESQKSKYFDIFFEYIPSSLKQSIASLSMSDLWLIKQNLLNLCVFLLQRGIYPIITEDSLGIKQGKIKYYLDVDYSKVVGSLDELTKAKDLQICSIFSVYQHAIQNGPNKLLSNFLLFKNKSESTIKNITKHASNLNSPRYTIVGSTRDQQRQQNGMAATQRNPSMYRFRYHTQPNFIQQNESNDLIKNNPYVSNRSSLHPIIQKQNGANSEIRTNQILSKSKDVKHANNQANRIIEQSVASQLPLRNPYNQLLRLQRCQSHTKIEQLISEHYRQSIEFRYQIHPSIKMTESKSRKFSVDNNQNTPSITTPFSPPHKQDQSMKKKKQSLYHQAFGHKNDHLTKQFNTLFDNESLPPSESKDEDIFDTSIKKDIREQVMEIQKINEQKIYQFKKDKMKREKFDMKQINNRVKKALQKSEMVLQNFKSIQQ